MRRLTALLFAGALAAPLSLTAQDTAPVRPGAPPRMRLQEHRVGPLGMGPAGGVFAPRMLINRRERLELTDEQVKQLEALSAEVTQAGDKADVDARPHQEKLTELWKADQPDAAALQAEMRAMMQARQTAALTATAAAAKAKGLLTAEQRGRVEGWADARRAPGRRFERGMGWGDGPRQGAGYRMAPRGRWF
jgi:Spy/CpxP family protein refolding chaperone